MGLCSQRRQNVTFIWRFNNVDLLKILLHYLNHLTQPYSRVIYTTSARNTQIYSTFDNYQCFDFGPVIYAVPSEFILHKVIAIFCMRQKYVLKNHTFLKSYGHLRWSLLVLRHSVHGVHYAGNEFCSFGYNSIKQLSTEFIPANMFLLWYRLDQGY